MKRLGVFIFYDPDGVLDDYILTLLDGMSTVCDEIIAICNGALTESGHEKLLQYCRTVCFRGNTGMDAGALKDFFTGLVMREDILTFDELVWFNDTCYGPIYPLSEAFQKMNASAVDFWGITVHANSNAYWSGKSEGGIPEHLQSYFIVIRNRLLHDERFFSFWENLKISDNFNATVANYELTMTQTFAAWGFSYGALCDTRALDWNPDCVCNPAADEAYILITKYRCPLLKRKDFIRPKPEVLLQCNGETMQRVMEYLVRNRLYDTSLIYKNLLRRYSQSQWHQNLCPTFILSSVYGADPSIAKPALIVAEVNHRDSMFELKEVLSELPPQCDLMIQTDCPELEQELQIALKPAQILRSDEELTGLAALIYTAQKACATRYEYCCFLQEKWGTPLNGFHLKESSQRYSRYRNLISGSHYILNVEQLFCQNPCLGLLVPPTTYIDTRLRNPRFLALNESVQKFVRHFTDQWKWETPVTQSSCLWCRTEAVKALLNAKKEELLLGNGQAVEYGIGFIAETSGYYTGTVIEQSQAALQWENRQWLTPIDVDDRKWMELQSLLQKVADVQNGTIAPEDIGMENKQLLMLLGQTLVFYLKKKLRLPIKDKERESFFIGFRDVLYVCRKARHWTTDKE